MRRVTPAAAAITHMAVFAALVAVLGQVAAIPVGPVPITLQTLGVMLAGAILGPWRAAGSMVLLNVLAVIGLPVLAQGSGGLGVYMGPTAGFILGFIPTSFVIGWIVQRSWPLRWWRTSLGIVAGGILVQYSCGVPVMMWQLGLTFGETMAAHVVFLPGDAAKVVFAILVTHSLAKAYPRPMSYARR